MIAKLKENRGEIALRLGLSLFIFVLLFLIVFNIRHAYQAIDRVIDRTNEAVLAVAALNGPEALGGVREGSAMVRNYTGNQWEHIVTTEDVQTTLAKSMNATVSGTSLIREGLQIDNMNTSYVNTVNDTLHFRTTMDLTISLLGGDRLSIMIPLEVKTTYEAKF